MSAFRIVTLGDSIPWGQGLLDTEKFDVLVKAALAPSHSDGVTLESVAHSGAVIGAFGTAGNPQVGEVPAPRLTIIEQCDAFLNSPETVDLVLLDGGINDVGVATIVNPLATIPTLSVRVSRACHDGMLVLLQKVSAKFSKPTCRILVTGYYAIISDRSDPLGIHKLLSLHGVAIPDFVPVEADFLEAVIRRCRDFFTYSTADIQQAIVDTSDPRIRFVPARFTDDNAIFVPNTSLLWGLDLDHGLKPLDSVAGTRRPLCDAAYPSSLEILPREQCYRASAGHPNPKGAKQYASQILAALA